MTMSPADAQTHLIKKLGEFRERAKSNTEIAAEVDKLIEYANAKNEKKFNAAFEATFEKVKTTPVNKQRFLQIKELAEHAFSATEKPKPAPTPAPVVAPPEAKP